MKKPNTAQTFAQNYTTLLAQLYKFLFGESCLYILHVLINVLQRASSAQDAQLIEPKLDSYVYISAFNNE